MRSGPCLRGDEPGGSRLPLFTSRRSERAAFHPPGSLARVLAYGAKPLSDDDILEEARAAFALAADAEAGNRREALDDLRFARLGEQWPEKVRRERELEGRPCLTINRLPAFIRQNINLWGEKLNAVLAHADYAVAGWLTKPLTSDSALTTANAGDDEARAAMIKFTGGAGPFTVTIPSVSKAYLVWNACTGPVTLTTGAGATVTVDAGDIVWAATDGAGVKTPGYGGVSIKDFVAQTAWSYNAGNLPAQAGAAGKFVKTDGTTASWQALSTADLSDYATAVKGLALAFAVAL